MERWEAIAIVAVTLPFQIFIFNIIAFAMRMHWIFDIFMATLTSLILYSLLTIKGVKNEPKQQ